MNLLKILRDIEKNSSIVKNAIRRHGFFAEHNYYNYLHYGSGLYQNAYFHYGANKGVLMLHNKLRNIWRLFPCGILSPVGERTDLLLDAVNHILTKEKGRKVVVEVTDDMKKDVLLSAKKSYISKNSYEYKLRWPVFDMKLWDPNLRGKQMKKLRNITNVFYRHNTVRAMQAKNVDRQHLRSIIERWMRKRSSGNEHTDLGWYKSAIQNRFKGFDHSVVLYVNGVPSSICAGWSIPNSTSYYSAIGILDYSCKGLGEIANIDDLNRLKKQGYDHVDFGGSDSILLQFKKKFRPHHIYFTTIFSLVKS